MTQDPKVQALIDAARNVAELNRGAGRTGAMYSALYKALAAFEPGDEMESVLPEWEVTTSEQRRFAVDWGFYGDGWKTLRHITRRPVKKGRDFWLRPCRDVSGFVAYQEHEAGCKGDGIIHVREVLD